MKKGITIILAAVLALGLGLGGLSVAKNAKSTKEFVADGFILDPSDAEYVTTDVDTQYYFAQGSKYKERYGTQVLFKDTAGKDNAIDTEHFLHYSDGSLGAFTKGVIMDVSQLSESNYGYYSLTKNTILVKNGNNYEMTSRGEGMNLSEYIWKISDTDYMLVSPNTTLNIGTEEVQFPDYVQITYVDNGIVRLTHQQGTYQTVAADSALVTQNGAELNLVGKSFMVDGEPVISLDDMAIDDDSYIDVDENVTDQPTIPTFNVINGKDGANGADGTDGEKGEEGEEGEEGAEGDEGAEGEEGSEGAAGAEGVLGTEGVIGKDGMEGDTGIQGFDGKNGEEGIAGKSFEKKADSSDIASVDLKARPTITVDAGEDGSGYDVSSSSAQMTLSLNNSGGSLTPGSTLIKLYNRATMELVSTQQGDFNSEAFQQSEGSTLENAETYAVNYSGLSPDTEYVLVVEGKYQVSDEAEEVQGELLRKIFKTEPQGISIQKDHVTDTEIAVKTVVTGKVDGYNVHFFYYDENGAKTIIATYPGTTGQVFTVNDTEPSPGANERPASFDDVKSNTVYYAELSNVTSGGKVAATDGSMIELKTLKETPYDKVEFDNNNTKTPVTGMKPEVQANNNNHSIKVDLHTIADPNLGISKYRIELYRSGDVNNAIQNGQLDELKDAQAAYFVDLDQLTSYSFQLEDTDQQEYRARVVAYFDDNEKKMELSTLFSDGVNLGTASNDVRFQFVSVEYRGDYIEGTFRIYDGNGTLGSGLGSTKVLRYINSTCPLKITITGEYDDSYSTNGVLTGDQLQFTDTAVSGVVIKDVDNKYYDFKFKKSGLHQNSRYSLVATGPRDTDGNNNIEGAEATTYLAGASVTTGRHNELSLFAQQKVNATAAFCYLIGVTQSSDTADEEKSKYSADVMETLQLQLIKIENGREKILGNTATLLDSNNLIKSSDFMSNGWKDRSVLHYAYNSGSADDNKMQASLGGADKTGLVLDVNSANAMPMNAYEVTPATFGIDDQDAELYTDGIFKIKVLKALDYTGSAGFAGGNGAGGNEIAFKEYEDFVAFGIEKKHVQAVDPNSQMNVTLLDNSAAASGYEDADLAENTLVGMRFSPLYPYQDVKEVIYRVYEINEDAVIAETTSLYPSYNDATYNYTTADYTKLMSGDTYGSQTQVGSLVLIGTEASANLSFNGGEVYFKNTQSTGITWKLPDGTTDVNGATILERGKRYIITYNVKALDYITPCHGVTTDENATHLYPYCAYNLNTPVPYYRSKVLEINKQVPVVERYPVSSTSESETWAYRIIDPDKAVVTSADTCDLTVKLANQIGDTLDNSTVQVTVSLTPMDTDSGNGKFRNGDFKNAIMTGFGTGRNGWYYKVLMPYRLLNGNSAPKYVESQAVQHFNAQTVASSGIMLKGLAASSLSEINENDKYNDGGVDRERPVVNEGNFRYKLTLQGNEISKYAALRVEVTDDNITNPTVLTVYDPVYLADIDTTNGIANAYLDQGPLKPFEGQAVRFWVKGYYSTRNYGFGDYRSSATDYSTVKTYYNASTGAENIFALRVYDPASGVGYYKKKPNGTWTNTSLSGTIPDNSVFLPGLAASSDGLVINTVAGKAATASLNQRYTEGALNNYAQVDAALTASPISNMLFDATGLYNGTTYYYPDKLAPTSFDINIVDDNGTNTSVPVTIGNIMAAVKKVQLTAGSMSVTLDMQLVGEKGDNAKVYAQLINKSTGFGNNVAIVKHNGNDALGEYFEVDTTDTMDYTDPTANANNFIQIDANNSFKFRIRGLTASTDYAVVFFTYDAAGKVRPLYSLDGSRVNFGYQFRTSDSININLHGPTFTYTKYDEKSVQYGFSIPGAEGSGYTLYYSFGTDESHLDNIKPALALNKEGDGPLAYYDSTPAGNHDKLQTTMNPGGSLALGGTYWVRIWAIDDGGSLAGEKKITFTTPSSLADPVFNLGTPTIDSANSKIKVNIGVNDSQKSVYQGKYTVELCRLDDPNNVMDSQDVTIVAGGSNANTRDVEFSYTDVTDYLVRVRANIDANNDGAFTDGSNGDKVITLEKTATAASTATASYGLNYNMDHCELSVSGMNNFTNVAKMYISIIDGDRVAVDANFDVTDENKAGTRFTKDINWAGRVTPGVTYTIQIVYKNSAGNTVGNGQVEVTPQSSSSNNAP